jgi:1,4-alpha-glucan branching enzyme
MNEVRFVYATSVKRRIFSNPRLKGSWDQHGRRSDAWSEHAMTEITGEDGCPTYVAKVAFDPSEVGQRFRWGVVLDRPQGKDQWGIATEVGDADSTERTRSFVLKAAGSPGQTERYLLTYGRWMGAQKLDHGAGPKLHFAVWAPNAKKVEVVFGNIDNGFIADDGDGIDPAAPVIPLQQTAGGVWEGEAPGAFDSFVGSPYMFRIKNAQGNTVFRTDIHSRWQIGRGDDNPGGGHYAGNFKDLDGTVSCSVVIDRDVVRKLFEPPFGVPVETVSTEEFWKDEFDQAKPVPTRLQDLVIYELHVGSLGFFHAGPGTLHDAMELIDYLDDLGVNAIELLPMSEFSGDQGWGYGNTHHFVIESSAGGRDKFKHFVRECHRHGIAVIQDVVYNHFDSNSVRAEYEYDSTKPEENIYYWYEGRSTDHPTPNGGYVQNGSSDRLPRLWEPQVRQLFVSSAAQYIEEFHIDGLRVDLTQALHRDNHLEGEPYSGIRNANLFGQKLLREWSRTLRMFRPNVFLIAEDHTGWDRVTAHPDDGGLGFDGTWFASFYHNLIGDAKSDGAHLLREAGFGDQRTLDVGQFARALYDSQYGHVVYHESHDEAGNSGGYYSVPGDSEARSLRTIRVAVNDSPIFGPTRFAAEARCRVVFGLSLLSAGNPMFYMGEEIGAQKLARYNKIAEAKEDLQGERAGNGAAMFRFYQDLLGLNDRHSAVRSQHIDIVHALPNTRVIAFTRRLFDEDLLVVASLNNASFADGYVIETDQGRLPAGAYREIFNSDSTRYGGSDLGNFGSAIPSSHGRIQLRIPASGFVVFKRE